VKIALLVPVPIRREEVPEGAEWTPDPLFNASEGVLRAVVGGVKYRKWKQRGRECFARVELEGGELNLAESPRKATRSW
jgi:hypothetical protein